MQITDTTLRETGRETNMQITGITLSEKQTKITLTETSRNRQRDKYADYRHYTERNRQRDKHADYRRYTDRKTDGETKMQIIDITLTEKQTDVTLTET